MPVNLRTRYASALQAFVEAQKTINVTEERIGFYRKQIIIGEEVIEKLRKEAEPLAEQVTKLKEQINAAKNG